MKNLRIHSCGGVSGFFVDRQSNEDVKCAFDLDKRCFSNCAACDMRGYVFCTRGVKKEFCIGLIVKDD